MKKNFIFIHEKSFFGQNKGERKLSLRIENDYEWRFL